MTLMSKAVTKKNKIRTGPFSFLFLLEGEEGRGGRKEGDHGVQQGCTHPRPSGLELCLVIARKMREESSEQSCRNLAHP